MTERRIVEETLKDGKVQYRVEAKTTIFGYVWNDWHTDVALLVRNGMDIHLDAVFHSLAEAKIHCGINPNPIVKREIIKLSDL